MFLLYGRTTVLTFLDLLLDFVATAGVINKKTKKERGF